MNQSPAEETWRVRLVGSNLPWASRADHPAEVGDELCKALLDREGIVEDANYQKISPNQFMIEIGSENYARNYQLLKDQILHQWREKLLAHLLTANSRQGRQEYRFGGPLKIEIQPVAGLGANQVRILSRVRMGAESDLPVSRGEKLSACLEILLDKRRWKLRPGIVTIGREASCDIFLDYPEIQQLKLVSSQHAYLDCKAGKFLLFDGAPNGIPSLNGTFVNLQRVLPGGVELHNGDRILLASLAAHHPNPATPGVAHLRFYQEC